MAPNTNWPKLFPFIPIGMGVIQPEWIELDEAYSEEIVKSTANTLSTDEIIIHYHPRK